VKIGDLVKLSSYGKSLKCNREYKNRVGVVILVEGSGVLPHQPVNVTWAGYDCDQTFHIRRDLKHVR